MSDQICKSGLWVDDETGGVVDVQPVMGSQLVAPGSVVTPDLRAAVELAGGSLDAPDAPEVVETATAEPDVDTATVKTTSTRKRG